MAASVGYCEDIYSSKDQYYWLTPDQYIMWRKSCYGKNMDEASAEIKKLIKDDKLIKTTEHGHELYFIDVTRIRQRFVGLV